VGYEVFGQSVFYGDDLVLRFTTYEAAAVVRTVGGPGGGSFTLAYKNRITGAIAYNAAASAIQAALESLPTIRQGSVVVAGGPLPTEAYITFARDLLGEDPATIQVYSQGLTGGVSPEVEILPKVANLSGWQALRWTAKLDTRDADSSAVFDLTEATGVSRPDAPNGQAQVQIDAADWPAGLDTGGAFHLFTTLKAKDNNGKTHTLSSLILQVLPRTSRASL